MLCQDLIISVFTGIGPRLVPTANFVSIPRHDVINLCHESCPAQGKLQVTRMALLSVERVGIAQGMGYSLQRLPEKKSCASW
jgi:hypothetical protein